MKEKENKKYIGKRENSAAYINIYIYSNFCQKKKYKKWNYTRFASDKVVRVQYLIIWSTSVCGVFEKKMRSTFLSQRIREAVAAPICSLLIPPGKR